MKLVLSLLFLIPTYSFAKMYTKNGAALNGYDPVTYFKQDVPEKGTKDILVKYNGEVFYFSSIENQKDFKKSPDKYLPEYGGWCAWAMYKTGSLVKVDPKSFLKIPHKNGHKVYLFYNGLLADTKKKWTKEALKNGTETADDEQKKMIEQADAKWKKAISK